MIQERAAGCRLVKSKENDRGALVVEATIVFPVCLVIIIFLLYLGNVYYQKSRIESIVVQAVLDGAAYSADPLLKTIEMGQGGGNGTGPIPGLDSVDYRPYRYIGGMFGGMRDIEDSVRNLIILKMGGLNTGLFTGMKPEGYQLGNNLTVRYHSCFVASSVSVDLEYRIEMPIRLLGQKERMSLKFRTHTEVPVSDSPEFIRNVNLVEDLLEVTGVKTEITEKVKELKRFFDKLFKK